MVFSFDSLISQSCAWNTNRAQQPASLNCICLFIMITSPLTNRLSQYSLCVWRLPRTSFASSSSQCNGYSSLPVHMCGCSMFGTQVRLSFVWMSWFLLVQIPHVGTGKQWRLSWLMVCKQLFPRSGTKATSWLQALCPQRFCSTRQTKEKESKKKQNKRFSVYLLHR